MTVSHQTSSSFRKAVVLLNFGGPRNLAEVPRFLYEILRDPNTIQLPIPLRIQNRLARFIANKRSGEVTEQYQALGGKSPILEATQQQCQHLEAALKHKQSDIRVYAIHRYLPDSAEQVIKQMQQDQIENIYLIPLYPHFSWATTGSSVEQFCQVMAKLNYSAAVQALRSYPNHPHYIATLTELLEHTLSQHNLKPAHTRILCSAHGLPQSYVDQGDPYLMELQATVEEFRKNFPAWTFELCFQSRVGPAKWLQPYTDELIEALPEQGVQAILFVPLSFVNDHLETLFEIDITYFDLARSVNLKPYRVPALETHPRFILLLSEQTLLWEKGLQGIDPNLLLPPSQHFRRYDQWLLYLWGICFLLALYQALT